MKQKTFPGITPAMNEELAKALGEEMPKLFTVIYS